MNIAQRLAAVRAAVAAACERAGRPRDAVRLVAVSKTHAAEAIREAYAAGQRDFGENYVQELVAKRRALADLPGIRWHFIGHLQSRKARDLAFPQAFVHGLDSLSAIQKLDAAAREAGLRIPVLLQVNVGDETSKSGVAPEAAGDAARALAACGALSWEGLMTIPPAVANSEAARPFFRRLRALRDSLSQDFDRPLPELSMGMSGDFESAILEGATLVRVGTAIFGHRETRPR